jgi:hypothetical protein
MAAALLSMLAFASAVRAEDIKPPPKIIPGGTDTKYDVIGVSTGMSCDEAKTALARYMSKSDNNKSSDYATKRPRLQDDTDIDQISVAGRTVPVKSRKLKLFQITQFRETVTVRVWGAVTEAKYMILEEICCSRTMHPKI